MIDVLSTMQVVLQEANFITHLTSINRSQVVHFEDDTLMGFGCVFDDPDELLNNWKTSETSLLTRYAPSLRLAGDKAWNVYSVFVCGPAGDSLQSRQVRWIEEDLDRTRKIAACGIATREDLMRALLPVLPLQFQAVLRPEDVTERLKRRILNIAPKAANVALEESIPVAEVVRLLGAPV
jgi:hypothetical protein